MNKITDQQIDEVIESLKKLFLSQNTNEQQAEEIKRRLDSLGHDTKALNAIANEHNIPKGLIHTILSKINK